MASPRGATPPKNGEVNTIKTTNYDTAKIYFKYFLNKHNLD